MRGRERWGRELPRRQCSDVALPVQSCSLDNLRVAHTDPLDGWSDQMAVVAPTLWGSGASRRRRCEATPARDGMRCARGRRCGRSVAWRSVAQRWRRHGCARRRFMAGMPCRAVGLARRRCLSTCSSFNEPAPSVRVHFFLMHRCKPQNDTGISVPVTSLFLTLPRLPPPSLPAQTNRQRNATDHGTGRGNGWVRGVGPVRACERVSTSWEERKHEASLKGSTCTYLW